MACSIAHAPSAFHCTMSWRRERLGRGSAGRFRVAAASQDSWEKEEARWLREEQRWVREEQRWLRQEKRWEAEAARMQEEIRKLKLEIARLSGGAAPTEEAAGFMKELKAAWEAAAISTTIEKQPVLEGDPPLLLSQAKPENGAAQQQRTLRSGSEGDDVRHLQEALAELGFYCGEEDIEASYFSSGTERAVKTWQSSVGVSEDGMVTAQMLAQLMKSKGTSSVSVTQSSAAVVTSPQQNVVAAASSETRVFLLGENRWEDKSRLSKKSGGSCYTCRGEGRTMCSECDGTGELNVEEQFLDWAGEGAKCPYCEGNGTLVCEDCGGKAVLQ